MKDKLTDHLSLEQQEILHDLVLLGLDSHDHVLGDHRSEEVTAEAAEEHVSGIAYELRRKEVLTELKGLLEE
jgi:hypothetical protein